MKFTFIKKTILLFSATALLVACGNYHHGFRTTHIQQYYKAAPKGVETRWYSFENQNAEKGKGGMTNKGAKGDAFTMVGPGDTLVLLETEGAGIITKLWSANSTFWWKEDRQKLSINMYWDGEQKPAVSAPFYDFFCMGLGQTTTFENEFFSMPEGKSFNCTIPMPFRKGAKIEVVNESDKFIMFYYQVDMVKVKKLPKDALYFHTYWNRDLNTTKGVDYEILPKVNGNGRFLGTNLGVIGGDLYRGSWFGEGEVKIYLDGDTEFPTLVGTGTEDYIGTGWGQKVFTNNYQGSTISNKKHDLYTFYRFHKNAPVYFHEDCKVTIQQMGNATKQKMIRMNKKGADLKPLWSFVEKDGYKASKRWLDTPNAPKLEDKEFPGGVSGTYYRSDDVSATAYFYLDKPSSNLPSLPKAEIRVKDLKERVFKKLKK